MKKMNNMKLYEEYINSSSNRITTLLNNMVEMFINSFNGENEIFSEDELNNITLIEVEKSIKNDVYEKNIVMDFTDDIYYYQLYFIVKIDDVKNNDPITKAYMKIKIYDDEKIKIIREWQSNLDIQEASNEEINNEGRFFVKVKELDKGEFEFIENFIIMKIADLKLSLEKNK
jgi:hypothetical protein